MSGNKIIRGLDEAIKGKAKFITFHTHSRDLNQIIVTDESGEDLINHYGYALETPISVDGDDDVSFTVDVETGQIIGWRPEMIHKLVENYEEE